MFDWLFVILKENLDVITKWRIFREYLKTFSFIFFMFIIIWSLSFFFLNKLDLISDNNTCEYKTSSWFIVKWDCDNSIFTNSIKNTKDLDVNNQNNNFLELVWIKDFLDFTYNNFSNIFFVIFFITIIYQLILPPKWFEEFLDRIYFYFVYIIKNDEELKNNIFIIKNVTK